MSAADLTPCWHKRMGCKGGQQGGWTKFLNNVKWPLGLTNLYHPVQPVLRSPVHFFMRVPAPSASCCLCWPRKYSAGFQSPQLDKALTQAKLWAQVH